MNLYIFLGMCAELMSINYQAATHTLYLTSDKNSVAEREAQLQDFKQICQNLDLTLNEKKIGRGFYSFWIFTVPELNLEVIYDLGCYIEESEE